MLKGKSSRGMPVESATPEVFRTKHRVEKLRPPIRRLPDHGEHCDRAGSWQPARPYAALPCATRYATAILRLISRRAIVATER